MTRNELPLDVAARDGRVRRTVVAAVQSAALRWSTAEMSVNRLLREQRALRSTERRFAGEAIWGIIRHFEPWQKLAYALLPEGDSARRILLLYFFYLVFERGYPATEAVTHLRQAGLPEDAAHWKKAWEQLLRDSRPDDAAAMRLGIPTWLYRELSHNYGDQAPALCAALNQRAPVNLRVNTVRTTREAVRERLRFEGVTAEPTPWSPWGLRIRGHLNVQAVPSYREGLVDVQDEGSQLLALITDAAPGMTVADVCAGGGGKLAALAAAMCGRGTLIATDVNRQRLDAARKRMHRLGLEASEYRVLPRPEAAMCSVLSQWQGQCDRVLVDAPCSGTGSWRRHPAERWRLKAHDVALLVAQQRSILTAAATLVKPGGRLIYATCSLLREENEAQAEWFAGKCKSFFLVMVQPPGWLPCGPYHKSLPHIHGTDGFFAAVFERVR